MTRLGFAKHQLCSPNIFGTLAGVTKDWPRLAKAVAERRRELGLSRDAVRRDGGPSDLSIQRIEENNEPHPRDDTINKLDGPLRWEAGSAQRVLSGGSPTVLERRIDLRDVDTDSLFWELRRRVGDAPRSPSDVLGSIGQFRDESERSRRRPG